MNAKFLISLSLTAALAGCVSFGPKTPDTLLSLRPTNAPAAGTSASGTLASALVVLEPSAEARIAVTRVPVQIDDSNLAYLKKTLWVERPSRLFQRLLAETIRAKGNRLVIEANPGGTGTQLSGRLLDMGYDARTRMAVVRFDAVKAGTDGRIDTRRFESMVPVAEAEAQYVGPALNEAANSVAQAVAEWVG
ncbi:cholesterol transport system auxiliary component [Novosphingobium hassiacum]|uniref:Cholesterol transport system auxiliary component n=1 Tax=Novosphingobium hassiacum TaxID=173676 RepID=A0A7W6A1R8_9SPHN|nr:ABC-type transport auxiliary lipoprotein family protein [Novosphingobium hassiacum]MBB3861675.1 cholesterol transport system auxiliary component [Novosphingobium hassiacum]